MPGPKRRSKKSTTRTHKSATMDKTVLEKKTTPTKKNSKPTQSRKKLTSAWKMRAEIQKEEGKSRESPKGLIFGMKWVGKTHVACSIFEQIALETEHYIFPSFSPARILDCNYSAKTIATKDFPKAYKNGDVIVIDAHIDPETKLHITDPIKRVKAVRNLIKECYQFTDGSLVIDGWDSVEKDAMFYVYRQFKIFEKEDGTLWYKEKMDYDQRPPKKVPERPCISIIPRMYAPRNTQLRKILELILGLTIPVLLVCHAEEKWKNNKATGIIGSNARDFIEDDMAFVIYMENIIGKENVKKMGITQIIEKTGRKVVFKKNRYQKGSNPEVKIITAKKFEFTDIFKELVGG